MFSKKCINITYLLRNKIKIFETAYLTGTIIAQIPTGSSRVKTNEFPSKKHVLELANYHIQ